MAASLPPPYQDVVSPEEEGIFRNALPATQVELHVSCRNLADMDVFSKSDPIVVLYTQAMGSKEWREFGRTECIKDNLNPDFVKSFIISYFFEEMQKLRFEVYDKDKPTAKLSHHDFQGAAECTLGSIVGEFGGRLQKPLINPKVKNPGTIIVTAEEVFDCKDVLTLELKGHKLDKKDFFGKSDPFLVFYRSNEDSSYTSFTACHRTEVIKNTLNPVWKPFTIPARTLCNGDYDRSIRVECYDWDRDGGHDLIGIFSTTVNELKSSAGMTFEVINPKKIKKKGYQNSGTISLVRSKLEQQPSFLDFIRGGTQINFTVAIDFTASNGDPRNVNSLHHISPHEDNQYLKALTAVGNICQDYDTDKLFPAFGFGARLPPNWQISHEFPLNGNPQDPMCSGIDGVITAYQQSIKRVQLYGPTNFAPIINQITRIARESFKQKLGEEYFVLLMITDGIISDMPQTKEAIVNAASFPISIIIVGVGQAEFDAMVELDGDTVRLSSRGRVAERDIVQFVPFRDFQSRGWIAQDLLSKEVLAEIPDQLLSFMTKHNIKPKPRQPLLVDSIKPVMPHSTNKTAPFGSQESPPPYSTYHGPPYPVTY
ncbi:copine-8-like isoform X1 [Acropora millepora]|uniref:copine-8-like isoform X1 n=2 Tax=Acropora millepora TaxID=45264 RepID=UPI001CF483A4|nr:copine-8-like isoform X1 [Acropora millepora]XP_044182240.1 copine-8-like isoform X1 [Acropora millepora]